MDLIPITQTGVLERPLADLPDVAIEVLAATAAMYRTAGFHPPWIAYLAAEHATCVGTCAFKSTPTDRRVEIAYFTFPGHERRGVATRMARALIDRARSTAPDVRICAQTLPEPSASTRILENLGFVRVGELDHPDDGRVTAWELPTPLTPPAPRTQP